jgi:hypothetical protein
MRRPTAGILLIALVALLLPAAAQGARLPREFLGIVPQTKLELADTARMKQARIGSIRTPIQWSTVERVPGVYNWTGTDEIVTAAAIRRIPILPFLYSTPGWASPKQTNLPTFGSARTAWIAFVREAVGRYGPRGTFWAENPLLPRTPIRKWQAWNEPNFFYFATPASPGRYAKLLKDFYRAVKSVDRGARVLAGGLFGAPDQRPPRAMSAAAFLNRLYRVPGIKRFFDGVALHPYAAGLGALQRLVTRVRAVSLRNRDRGADLYITEMGWGSQPNQRKVAFEVGPGAQAKLLTDSYSYLIRSRGRLRLRGVYWFTWKDVPGTPCSFCDSVGLFHQGLGFRAKPAWRAFLRISRGRLSRRGLGRGNRRAHRHVPRRARRR